MRLAGAVTVDDLHHRGAFSALAPAWRSLGGRLGLDGPFHRPEWFAVVAAARVRPPDRLRLLVAHRARSLAAVLPLVETRSSIGGVPARTLRSLSDDHSQRFELLSDGEEATAALWRHLARDPDWDVLELRDLPALSPSADRLVELAARDGFPTGAWASQRSPRMPLPATERALDEALPPKFRANLRRRRRGLEAEHGEVALERVGASGAAIDRALDDGLALEASGWKSAAGTAIASEGDLRRRYRAWARLFARSGELGLHFLTVGGRRVAFHFAVESGGIYYLFKPGYDESLARFGLGHLLVDAVARALIARGARELDFLGEDVPWKREWTALVRPHQFRYVFRPTPFGRGLWTWKFRVLPSLRERVAAAARSPLPNASRS